VDQSSKQSTICWLLPRWLLAGLVAVLIGCTTTDLPEVKVVDNAKKDEYVERLEREAEEGASALTVAKEHIDGKGKALVVLTAERLAGIRKATKEGLERYAKAMQDDKALKAEQEKAERVDAETTALYGMVDDLDRQNRDLKIALDAKHREMEWADLRSKFLMLSGVFAFAGAGLLVISTFTGGKGKGGGLILIALSLFFGGAPFVIRDVVESAWFPWASAGVALVALAWGSWAYWVSHKDMKCRLTPNSTSAQ
jgi:hypothetical protein